MQHVLSVLARYAIPLGVLAAKLILNEGLTEIEKGVQSLIVKAAESFLKTQEVQ